jgi:hypothetical protein
MKLKQCSVEGCETKIKEPLFFKRKSVCRKCYEELKAIEEVFKREESR